MTGPAFPYCSPSCVYRPHLRLLLPFLLLLLVSCQPADGRRTPKTSVPTAADSGPEVVAAFDSPEAGSQFSHLTLNTETQMLYVGADNFLYSLKPDLTLDQKVRTGPKLDHPDCPPPIPQFMDCDLKTEMDSYSKALLVDYANKKLIACSSLYHGFCEKRDLTDITKKDLPPIYEPVVASSRNATTVAFIAPGPAAGPGEVQRNVLYVSASWTRHRGQIIWREKVAAFSSRNLNNFSLTYSDNFRQTHIKIEIQQRESFPVRYIYGFGYEGFSYMTTVQKRSTQSEEYTSKIFRVCQNDKNFYSYVEVELVCESRDSRYNLLQAAYLGKPGKVLAQSLNIPTTEDVLYTVFSKGYEFSSAPTGEAALCVYPMRVVWKKFTENIQECFRGRGNTGPDHIATKTSECLEIKQPLVTDDYCGELEFNQPIAGSDPIVSQAALLFPRGTNVSAISVTTTQDYTVAFVGTTNGQLMKVSLESYSEANVYSSVRVQGNRAVKKDMMFDEEREHVYVITNSRT